MNTHSTVIHLPVTFRPPADTTPEKWAQFLADEAALDMEKMGLSEGEIVVGDARIDPVTPAGQATVAPDTDAPTATSCAAAAGWDGPR